MKKTKQKVLAVAHSAKAPAAAVPATKTKQLFVADPSLSSETVDYFVWQNLVGLLNHSCLYDMQSSSFPSLLACHSDHKSPVACAPMFSCYTWGIVSAVHCSAPLHKLSELDYSFLVLAHHHHCRHCRPSLFCFFEFLPAASSNQHLSNFFQRYLQATAVTKIIP